VLRIWNEEDWIRFRAALNGFNLTISQNETENDILLEAAETKDKRQQKLDHFFREAYSHIFNIKDMHDDEVPFDKTASEEVLQMRLSKVEFADALGMRSHDLFVERMFACMVSDGNDSITFQEFLDVLRKFAQGKILTNY
jgi:dual oxidase